MGTSTFNIVKETNLTKLGKNQIKETESKQERKNTKSCMLQRNKRKSKERIKQIKVLN